MYFNRKEKLEADNQREKSRVPASNLLVMKFKHQWEQLYSNEWLRYASWNLFLSRLYSSFNREPSMMN